MQIGRQPKALFGCVSDNCGMPKSLGVITAPKFMNAYTAICAPKP